MTKHMLKVTTDQSVLAERIRDALEGQGLADVGIDHPDYPLAAHAFVNYVEAVTERGGLADRDRAAGHLFFALCGYKPTDDDDAGRLFNELSLPLRRLGAIATKAAWVYIRECIDHAEKVPVQ